MCKRVRFKSLLLPLAVGLVLSGCSYSGDTSGFKAEKQETKAELQKQIEEVKNNPKIPESMKSMAISSIQKKIDTAKN